MATAVFDKDDDFDPQLDPIVRVEAGRLRLRLLEYYAGPGQADSVVIEIPKGGYVPSFRVLEGPRRPAEVGPRDNPAAYRLYLKGRYFWGKRTAEDLNRAAEYFRRALAVDPGYARAYVGLGDCYVVLATFGFLAPGEACAKAKAAATAALDIDQNLPEAYTTLACLWAFHDWDWNRAEAAFRRAIEVNPGYALAHQWYGACLIARHRFEEGLAALRAAEQLEPLALMVDIQLAAGFYMTRRYAQAEEACRAALELDPNFWPAHYFLGLAYEQEGLSAQGIGELLKAKELSAGNPSAVASLGHAYAHTGSMWEAARVRDELKTRATAGYVPPFAMALVHAGLREKEAAFEELEKAFHERSPLLGIWLNTDPRLDELRSESRFRELAASMGLPASTGQFARGGQPRG